jgi:hypothetical protein
MLKMREIRKLDYNNTLDYYTFLPYAVRIAIDLPRARTLLHCTLHHFPMLRQRVYYLLSQNPETQTFVQTVSLSICACSAVGAAEISESGSSNQTYQQFELRPSKKFSLGFDIPKNVPFEIRSSSFFSVKA